MATNLERSTAIVDALINGTSTAGQRARVAEALYAEDAAAYAALSNAEKTAIIPTKLRQFVMSAVRQYEKEQAARAAANSAGNADL